MAGCVCIPFIGSIFNGNGYPINRFIFGLTFLVSLIVVIMLPKFYDLKKKELKILFLFSILFGLYVLGLGVVRTKRNMGSVIGICIVLLCCMAYQLGFFHNRKKLLSIMMTCVLLVWNAHFSYSPLEEEQLANNYLDRGKAVQHVLQNSPAAAIKGIIKNNERFDTNIASGYYQNVAALSQQRGVSVYYSTCSQYVGKIGSDFYLPNSIDYSIQNLDGRTYLDSLFGVKYYLTDTGSNMKVPYGYHLKQSQNGYQIYASDYDSSLAFTSDHYISSADYDKLTISEKQQALLQGVILEKSNGLQKADLQFDDQDKTYQFNNAVGLNVSGNKIEVTSKNASVELLLQGNVDSEYYTVLEGLRFKGKNAADFYIKKELSEKSLLEKRNILVSKLYTKPSEGMITASVDGINKRISVLGEESVHYAGKTDFLMNLGYYDQAVNKIKLTFSETGTYTFDNLSVVCQPMSSFDRDMNEREKHIVKDISFGTNTMDMNVNESDDSMLFVAIPYNKGWSATVNGKKVEVQKADDTCMAVKVPKGASKVHWNYTNSYFVMGAGIAGVSWIGFFAFAVYERRKRKDKNISISS